MAKGMTLKQADVSRLGSTAKFFTGRPIVIDGNTTFVKDFYYHKGRRVEVKGCEMPLESVFHEISRVMDESGIVIAERLNPRAALISTGKGKSKKLKKIDTNFVQELVTLGNK